MGIFGEFLVELGRRLVKGPAAVERLVPAVEIDIVDEAHPRLVVGDLPDEEAVGIPAVEDVADVEDDGGRPSHTGLASELSIQSGIGGTLDRRVAAPAQ